MSIARVKHWLAGEVLTANDLNNEFDNLANNVLLEPFVASTQVDVNGQLLILDANGDTLLDASTDNTIDVTIGGADDFRFSANLFSALSGSAITLDAGNLTLTSGDVVFTSGRVLGAKASDVASATSITVPTTGNAFDLTGTITIESFSTSPAGTTYRVRYTGAGLNLIYNATALITPYATDYRLVTNEVFDLVSLGSGNYYMVSVGGAPGLQTGIPFPWWGTNAPVGGVLMDGTALLCTTYHGLSKILVPTANSASQGNVGTSVAAFTANSVTDVLTCTAHGLVVNDIFHVTTSAADLPLNMLINTVYFVKTVPDANTLTLSATRGGATFDIADAGTGTHTLHNKVNAPDQRGRNLIGLDNLGGSAASRVTSASTNGVNSTTLGGVGGNQDMPQHQHIQTYAASGAGDNLLVQHDTTKNVVGTSNNLTLNAGTAGVTGVMNPWIAGGMAIRF